MVIRQVVTAEEHRLHRSFVSEYFKVPAITALSSDDSWAGNPRTGAV